MLYLVETAHTDRVLPQISRNDWGGAFSDIKYTLNRFPNHPRGLLLMALYGRLTKKHAFVIPYFEKAIRLYPEYALTYAQYGSYLVTVGNLDVGIKKLERAAKWSPILCSRMSGWLVPTRRREIQTWPVKRKTKRKSWDLKGR